MTSTSHVDAVRIQRRFVPPLSLEEDWARRVGSATTRLVSPQEALYLWRQGSVAGLRGATAAIIERFRSSLEGTLRPLSQQIDQWHFVQFRRALAQAKIEIKSHERAKADLIARAHDKALQRADGLRTQREDAPQIPVERVRVSAPDVREALRTWRESGAQEIAGWGRDALARIEDRLERAWNEGWTEDRVATEIEEAIGASRSQSEVYARNQIGKLYGTLVEQRQKKIGVKKYTWTTQQDSRVRPTHRALQGRKFEWTAPPSIGHPGEEYGCRCIAEPDFDELRERQLRINRQRRGRR